MRFINDHTWNAAIAAFAIGALMLVLGFAYGTTFATGCNDAGAVYGCIEFVLYRYQTFIAIFGALAAAFLSAQPVWKQLRELEKQSAVQSYEMLRRHVALITEEKRLANEAQLQAQYAVIIEKYIRENIDSHGPTSIKIWLDKASERYSEIESLQRTLELAGVNKWADSETERTRAEVILAMQELKIAVYSMRGNLELAMIRNTDVHNSSQWFADRKRIKELTVAPQSVNLDRTATRYVAHVQREIDRVLPILRRTATAAMSL